LAFIIIIVAGGWIILTRDNSSLPAEEEEQDPYPRNPSMYRMGNRTNIFEKLYDEIQELVNVSAGPEEILELVVNVTEQMSMRFNQSDRIPVERVSPILDFFEELKTEIQAMIDQGATAQEVQELVSNRIHGQIGERPQTTPPG